MHDNPLKWLLAELPDYIEPGRLAELMERYEANKEAYARQTRIKAYQREISLFERAASIYPADNPRAIALRERIATRKDRIAQLNDPEYVRPRRPKGY